MFHPHWREMALSRSDERFDLIVIGGGINGCGILLDAAQRGLRVLLIERGDIGHGTSSRSSKLVHGGLRYLKQMQFRITRLACRERDRMLTLNPGLVRPVRFLYPVIEDEGMPGWTVDLGLWMYDRLTLRREGHTHLERGELGRALPALREDCVQGGLAYTDAVADDAQLTLAVAATGFAYGGGVLTRAEVLEGTTGRDGRIDGVVVRDLETGGTLRLRAHLVVNAAGVWVDRVREAFGLAGRRSRALRLSMVSLSISTSMSTSMVPVRVSMTSKYCAGLAKAVPGVPSVLLGTKPVEPGPRRTELLGVLAPKLGEPSGGMPTVSWVSPPTEMSLPRMRPSLGSLA